MFRRLITSIRQNCYSFLISVVGLGLLAIAVTRPQREVRVLSSDLAFLMKCDATTKEKLEEKAETFLQAKGFKSLNRGKLMRQYTGYNLGQIIGINNDKTIIDISALPNFEGDYSVMLRSPPPTKHAEMLEHELLTFADNTLSCKVRQITRDENSSAESDLYALEVARIEGWFQQAYETEQGRQLK